MKNQLRSILSVTAATLATVFVSATSASASGLSKALFPYLPTEDEVSIKTDEVNLFETTLPDFSNLDADYDSIDIMFLGELAGYYNTLQLSVNGSKTSVFEKIRAYNEITHVITYYQKITHEPIYSVTNYVGTYDSQYNDGPGGFLDIGTVWNSRTDGGIERLAQGDNLNFWLNPNGDATKAFNTGDGGKPYSWRLPVPLFKAYTLKGFEEYTIFAVDDNYYSSRGFDHNDLVFAVKFNHATDIPEPSTTLALIGLSASALVLGRKSFTK